MFAQPLNRPYPGPIVRTATQGVHEGGFSSPTRPHDCSHTLGTKLTCHTCKPHENPICFHPTVYKMELESNGHIEPTLLWLAVMILACSLCFFGSHVPLCTLENAPAIRFQFDTDIVKTNTDGRHLQSHSSGGTKFVVDSSRHRHFPNQNDFLRHKSI